MKEKKKKGNRIFYIYKKCMVYVFGCCESCDVRFNIKEASEDGVYRSKRKSERERKKKVYIIFSWK